MNWVEYEVQQGKDEFINRGVFCIACKCELVKTKRFPDYYRHITTGTVTCLKSQKARSK